MPAAKAVVVMEELELMEHLLRQASVRLAAAAAAAVDIPLAVTAVAVLLLFAF